MDNPAEAFGRWKQEGQLTLLRMYYLHALINDGQEGITADDALVQEQKFRMELERLNSILDEVHSYWAGQLNTPSELKRRQALMNLGRIKLLRAEQFRTKTNTETWLRSLRMIDTVTK